MGRCQLPHRTALPGPTAPAAISCSFLFTYYIGKGNSIQFQLYVFLKCNSFKHVCGLEHQAVFF